MKTVTFTINAEAFHFIRKQARSEQRRFNEHLTLLLQQTAQRPNGGRIDSTEGIWADSLARRYPQFYKGKSIRKSIRVDERLHSEFTQCATRNGFLQLGRFVTWFVEVVAIPQMIDWIWINGETAPDQESVESNISNAIPFCSDKLIRISQATWHEVCQRAYRRRQIEAKRPTASTFEEYCLSLQGTRPRYGKYQKLSFKMKPSGSTGMAVENPAVEITDLNLFREDLKRNGSRRTLNQVLWELAKFGKLAMPELQTDSNFRLVK